MCNSNDDSFFEDFVWVQMKGFCPWPAKIIEPLEDVVLREGHFRVYFFGTHQTAYVSETRMWPYLKMKSKFLNEKSLRHKGFRNGISEIENIMKEYAEQHKISNDSSPEMPLANGESDSSSDNNADYHEISIKAKKHSKSQTTNAESEISDESNVKENDDSPNSSLASTEANPEHNSLEHNHISEEEAHLSEPESSDHHVTSPVHNSFDDGIITPEKDDELEYEEPNNKALTRRRLRYSSSSCDVREEISPNLNHEGESVNEKETDLDLLNRLVSKCYSSTPIVKLERIPFHQLPVYPTNKSIQKNVDDSDRFTQHRKRRHSLSEKQTPRPKRRRHSTHSAHASYPELLNLNKSTLQIHIGSHVYKEFEVHKEPEVDKEADKRNRLIAECYSRVPIVKLHRIPLSEPKRPKISRNRVYRERREHPVRNSRVAANLKSQIPLSNIEPDLRKESDSDISERLRSECLSKHIPQVRIEVMSNELITRLSSPPLTKQRIGLMANGPTGITILNLLLGSGFPLSVWNKYNTEVQRTPQSVRVRSSISQIMMECDTVICCLTDTKEVTKAINEKAVLRSIEGKILINCTIIDPESSLNLKEAIETYGGCYFECPLLPSKKNESERMTGLVSGDKEIICSCTCLHSICEDMFYLGEIPNANKMACVISTFSGTAFVGVAEGIAFANKLNMDVDLLFNILKKSQLGAQLFLERGKDILLAFFKGNYVPKIFLKSISQDLLLSLSMSDIPMPVTAMARQVYLKSGKGNELNDISAIRDFFVKNLK